MRGWFQRFQSGAVPRGGGHAFAHPRLDRVNTLRAVAILGVFFYHVYSTIFQGSFNHVLEASELWVAPLRLLTLSLFFILSNLDRLVTIFFVVSGYFLHRYFLKWRERNPGHPTREFDRFFLWRRFWRLIPPFWFALLFTYVFTPHPFAPASLKALAINAAMLKTLVGGYFFSLNEAHWYVAAQWQLDLLYPVFLYILVRRSFAWSFVLACGLAVLFLFFVPQWTATASILYLPFRWWGDWAIGALVAERHARYKRLFPHPRWSLATILALIAIAFYFELGLLLWVMIRVGLVWALEVLLVSHSRLNRLERILAPIGVCSYSFYLLHLPLINLTAWGFRALGLDPRLPSLWLAASIAALAITVILSWASYVWIEEGSVKLGNRLWRKFMLPRRPSTSPPAITETIV